MISSTSQAQSYVCRSPVLICGFNRPDLLASCLEYVKHANPPKVYISIDGPRAKVINDITKVEACRQLAQSIDWCDEVHLKIEPVNLGCRRAMEGALDWFFEAEPEGIVLEDDIEASPQFFQFCDLMLNRYRSDKSIGCINGWTPVPPDLAPHKAAYLTKYAHIWGWATWRRVWHSAQRDPISLTTLAAKKGTLLSRSHGIGIDQFWSDRLRLVMHARLDSWALPFAVSLASVGVLSISPPLSLVKNRGFGPNSTHTSRQVASLRRDRTSDCRDSWEESWVALGVDSSFDLDWAHDKYHFGFGEGANYWPRLKSKAYYYLHVVPFGKRLIPFINRFR